MSDVMKGTTYVLLQTGEKMCIVGAVHPPSVRDMRNAYDGTARAFQSDCKGGTISNNNIRHGTGALITSPLVNQKRALQMKKQKYP